MMPLVPMPHQVEDSDALLDYRFGYLWADPGTGKTLTAIEVVRKIGTVDRIVIVCPKIAMTMWREALRRQFGDKFYVHLIRSGAAKSIGPIMRAGAVVVTYDLMANATVKRLVREYAEGKTNKNDKLWNGKPLFYGDPPNHPNSVMVLDEAHYVKSKDAKRTKAILGESITGDEVLQPYSTVLMLTGTPIMRHADDLWKPLVVGRYEILKHYNVETYQKFVNEFCRTEVKQYHTRMQPKAVIVGSKNHAKLKQLLDDCKVIRRRLVDVVDNLPPITYRVIDVGYTGAERVNVNVATLMRDLADPDHPLSKLRRKLGVAKAADIAQYAKEHGNKPLLIGYWHTDVAMELLKLLSEDGMKVQVINGATKNDERDKIVAAFNAGTIDVVLGQVRAMGVAANMQDMCSHILIAEELVSPGELDQFIARVYRNGQKRHVQVDFMRSEHDLDTALVYVRERKQDTIDKLVT